MGTQEMVVSTSSPLYSINYTAYHCRREFSYITVRIFLILSMTRILQTNKKNLLQMLGMVIAYYISKKIFFLYLAGVLLFLLIFFPSILLLITQRLDKLISFAGNIIKKILLGILFIFLITPMGLAMRVFKRKGAERGKSFYVIAEQPSLTDMKKMW